METPTEVKEMVGKSYLFSGQFIDSEDRVEQEYLVKDVKMCDSFLKDVERTFKHPCFKLLINIEGKNKWTKPLPIRSINLI